jgi:AcrR family transcriptional regulator
MSANDPAGDAPTTWREMAVARSLDPARVRAENRVQRFLDAALELMTSASGKEFTVQEVVERSGQSLRSFYQYFAGKHELLLALFEDAVRSTADQLRDEIDAESDPLERLHRFVVSYYRVCRPAAKGRGGKSNATPAMMAEFAQQLLTSHPDEASRAFAPIVALFEEVLDEAATAGVIRPDMPHSRLAGIVLQAIMFNAFATIIARSGTRDGGDGPEQFWDLLVHGIGTD